jgi:ATP-dependent DNA helicase RecQ
MPPEPSASLDAAHRLLRERFGYADFRPGQAEALRAVLTGRNLLAVMPTGSGKSLLYQLPALLDRGLTLVISPLISLMKDQVDDLNERGIPATFINSSLSLEEQHERIGHCVRGEVRLLYVAPERFQSQPFLSMLRRVQVARMAVDEAHCISEWGHDFRPDYRRLKQYRQEAGAPLVTALTATATPRVQADIITSLGLERTEVDVHVHGFDRPNLALSVVHARGDDQKISFLRQFLAAERGSGIIYAGTRRATEEAAEALRDVEKRMAVYHAGLEPEERAAAQEAFMTGRARVAVATVAFGMGIDKADVRFVVHYHLPGSVEQYYQEIGRSGRDGLPSRCVLLYSPGDRKLREFLIDLSYPPRETVESVYDALWEIPENPIQRTYAEIAEGCRGSVKDGQVGASVRLLDGAGVTRALTAEAGIGVTISRPGAAILADLRGPVERRVFEALATAADLETPGAYHVALDALCRAAELAPDQVRRALTRLDHEGHLDYAPPFRGRGVEKLVDPQPDFDGLRIDWARQNFLRQLEYDKLDQMESYVRSRSCRRRFIVRCFGEQSDLRCGTCDCCSGEQSAVNHEVPAKARTHASPAARGGAVTASAARRPRRTEDEGDIRSAALRCVAALRTPVGIGKVAAVLTGSRAKWIEETGAEALPVFGAVRATQQRVRDVLERMVKEGLFDRDRRAQYPVLRLTETGRETLERCPPPAVSSVQEVPHSESRTSDSESGIHRSRSKPPDHSVHSRWGSSAAELDQLVDRFFAVAREAVPGVLPALGLYHPREVATRLIAQFRATTEPARRGRAVWAVGELGEHYGLDFLIECAQSDAPDIARTAVAALGKVAERLHASAAPSLDRITAVLSSLQRSAISRTV